MVYSKCDVYHNMVESCPILNSQWYRTEGAIAVHRSVAQATCVLIEMEYNADDAMKLIQEKRAVADPYVGYIQKRIRLFEKK